VLVAELEVPQAVAVASRPANAGTASRAVRMRNVSPQSLIG
jgi:hypothetical protein